VFYVQELKNKDYHLPVSQCQLSADSFTWYSAWFSVDLPKRA